MYQQFLNFLQKNRWKKKGIAVVPMAWLFEVAGPIMATISIYHVDGSVTISHGGIEVGQGINTKVTINTFFTRSFWEIL